MKTTLQIGDRVAYSVKFLRGIGDYSHDSASMRGTVTGIREIRGMKFPLVKIAWDTDTDELRAGALACNLVRVQQLAAEAAMA